MEDFILQASTPPEIRIALVDTDAVFRCALESHLAGKSRVSCVATFESVPSTPTRQLRQLGVRVLLLEPASAALPVHTLLGALLSAVPECIIVILSRDDAAPSILAALQAGAGGYLLKSDGFDELLGRISEAAQGGVPMSCGASRAVAQHLRKPAVPSPATAPVLTRREREVMDLLASGARYKEAAEHLGISLDTVRSHVRNAYRKLGVGTLIEALHLLKDGPRGALHTLQK